MPLHIFGSCEKPKEQESNSPCPRYTFAYSFKVSLFPFLLTSLLDIVIHSHTEIAFGISLVKVLVDGVQPRLFLSSETSRLCGRFPIPERNIMFLFINYYCIHTFSRKTYIHKILYFIFVQYHCIGSQWVNYSHVESRPNVHNKFIHLYFIAVS